jgi:hypothetical protein
MKLIFLLTVAVAAKRRNYSGHRGASISINPAPTSDVQLNQRNFFGFESNRFPTAAANITPPNYPIPSFITQFRAALAVTEPWPSARISCYVESTPAAELKMY